MHSRIAQLSRRLEGKAPVLVLPEGGDHRIQSAARILHDRNLARIVLLGSQDDIGEAADLNGISLEGFDLVDPANSKELETYSKHYLAARPRAKPGVARRLVARPLYFGGSMLRAGRADAMLAGAANTTAHVIEASLATVGLAGGIDTPASAFLMLLPDAGGAERTLVYADCAVNIDPDANQLADIAVSAATTAATLLDTSPHVALLSFSTNGSANHPLARKVADATAIAAARVPEIAIAGELQADAALDERVARIKLGEPGAVGGRANVLVFPDLGAGNIAYKLTQYLAGARAIGPLLLGFAHPVADVSRGASIDDIVDTAIVTLAGALPG